MRPAPWEKLMALLNFRRSAATSETSKTQNAELVAFLEAASSSRPSAFTLSSSLASSRLAHESFPVCPSSSTSQACPNSESPLMPLARLTSPSSSTSLPSLPASLAARCRARRTPRTSTYCSSGSRTPHAFATRSAFCRTAARSSPVSAACNLRRRDPTAPIH